MTSRKILITSALLYANAPLHFGHLAGAYLPADCYARFQRLRGHQVLYVSGSDEYGMAITLSAELAGRTPKEQVDLYHEKNKALFQKLAFSFDNYSRTTWLQHDATVQQFFLDLLEAGFIEPRVTDQLYSEKDKRFLADRYVVGRCPKCSYAPARGDECPSCGTTYDAVDLVEPKSRLSGSPLVRKATNHWFLRLDLFQQQLLDWLATKSWKSNVINFVRGYIGEIHPRAITRDSDWGVPIPLPNTEGKVLYVWFDAPIGYISAVKEWAQQQGRADSWRQWWCDPATELVQFIGKDNIPFHAAIFPAMIMGQKEPYKLVDQLPANEFYKLEGRKFSKSDGWFIDIEDFLLRYTSDQLRFAIASTAPETGDAEFSWSDFQQRCNGDLVGKYGNLAHRVLLFAQRYTGGVIPNSSLDGLEEQLLLQQMQKKMEEIASSYEQFHLKKSARQLMELAQLGNVYFDSKKPWVKVREKEEAAVAATIRASLELLKALALASFPIMPEAASSLWKLLGGESLLQEQRWDAFLAQPLIAGTPLPLPHPLFAKIEDEQIHREVEALHAAAQQPPVGQQVEEEAAHEGASLITLDELKKAELRVARILSATPLPKSHSLLKLCLSDGSSTQRVVVSGIAQHYRPEQLIDKKVVLVANLKPATFMGVESHGMLLAARSNERIELLMVQEAEPGTLIS